MNSNLNLDSSIQKVDSFISADLEESLVMMDTEKGQYYNLNKIGAKIWQMADQPVAVSEICSQLIDIYDISDEQCKNEVIAYLTRLSDLSIIKATNKGS